MPRYVKVPEDVALRDPLSRQPIDAPPVTFESFVGANLLCHPRFASGYAGAKAQRRIDAALERSPAGSKMVLDQADWEVLRDAINDPQYLTPSGPARGFASVPPVMIGQLVPFMEAILEAPEEP